MASGIRYKVGGSIMRATDVAHGSDSEAVYQAVIDTISTEVEIELGGQTIFLAMLQDPDHWSSDWEERGVEDVEEWLAGLVQEEP